MLKPNNYPKVVTTAAASLLLMGAGALVSNNNVHADEVHNDTNNATANTNATSNDVNAKTATLSSNKEVNNPNIVKDEYNNTYSQIKRDNNSTTVFSVAEHTPNQFSKAQYSDNSVENYSDDISKMNNEQKDISNRLADNSGTLIFRNTYKNSTEVMTADYKTQVSGPLSRFVYTDIKNPQTYSVIDHYGNEISKDVIANNYNNYAKDNGLHVVKESNGTEVVYNNKNKNIDSVSTFGDDSSTMYPFINIVNGKMYGFFGNEIDASKAKNHFYDETEQIKQSNIELDKSGVVPVRGKGAIYFVNQDKNLSWDNDNPFFTEFYYDKSYNDDDKAYIADEYGNILNKDILINNINKYAKAHGLHIGTFKYYDDGPLETGVVDDKGQRTPLALNINNNQIVVSEFGDVIDPSKAAEHFDFGNDTKASDSNNTNGTKKNDTASNTNKDNTKPSTTTPSKDNNASNVVINGGKTNSSENIGKNDNKSTSINKANNDVKPIESKTNNKIDSSNSAMKNNDASNTNVVVSKNSSVEYADNSAKTATEDGYHVSSNGQVVVNSQNQPVMGWTVSSNGSLVDPQGNVIETKSNNVANNGTKSVVFADNSSLVKSEDKTSSVSAMNLSSNSMTNSTESDSSVDSKTLSNESVSKSVKSDNSAKLPQTNESNSNTAVAAGLGLLSLTGLFGLGYRRRH